MFESGVSYVTAGAVGRALDLQSRDAGCDFQLGCVCINCEQVICSYMLQSLSSKNLNLVLA